METCQWIFLWKSGTPLWICTNLARLCPAKEGTFQSSRSAKKCDFIWRYHKNLFFWWKILKIHTLSDSARNQLSRVSWIIIKFGTEMPDTFAHITRGVKIFEWLSSAIWHGQNWHICGCNSGELILPQSNLIWNQG